MNQTAYIALGSNLHFPIMQVQSSIIAITHVAKTRLIAHSSLYQTAAVGYDAAQLQAIPDFINAVAKVETALSAFDLLDAILNIEQAAGRERPYRNAPRVLDCDLLLYGETVMQTEKLILPHPRMHLRGFVLLPLFEISPELFIPNHGKIATFITPELGVGIKKLTSE